MMRALDPIAERALPWLIVLAALLRLQALGWDSFTGLHPDEGNLVRAAAALQWPNAMVPEFHAYNGLAVWIPRLVAWPVCGWEAGTGCITWAARLISALAGTAAVWIAAIWARDLGGALAGAAAALLLGLSVPLIQWAHFGTTESALILVICVLGWMASRALDGRLSLNRFSIWCGIITGIGLGLKTTVLAFALVPLVTVVLLRPTWRAGGKATFFGAAIALVLWLATTPAIFLDWAAWRGTMQFENGVVQGTADVFWTWQFFDRPAGVFELRQLWGATEGVGSILAFVGLAAIATDRARLRQLAPVLLLVLVYGAIITGWHARFFRYLAPILPVILVLAAVGVAEVLRRFENQSLRVLMMAALAWFAIVGLDQAMGYRAEDPRIAASDDLSDRARNGDIVLLEPREVGFGVPASAEVRTLSLEAEVDTSVLAQNLAEGQFLVLMSRRNWSVLTRWPERFPWACPYYQGLASGALGYRVVSRHTRWSPLGPLLRPDLGQEETRVVFDAPEVVILERVEARSVDEIIATLNTAMDCDPEDLAAAWRAPS